MEDSTYSYQVMKDRLRVKLSLLAARPLPVPVPLRQRLRGLGSVFLSFLLVCCWVAVCFWLVTGLSSPFRFDPARSHMELHRNLKWLYLVVVLFSIPYNMLLSRLGPGPQPLSLRDAANNAAFFLAVAYIASLITETFWH
jgi:hypothetical protein